MTFLSISNHRKHGLVPLSHSASLLSIKREFFREAQLEAWTHQWDVSQKLQSISAALGTKSDKQLKREQDLLSELERSVHWMGPHWSNWRLQNPPPKDISEKQAKSRASRITSLRDHARIQLLGPRDCPESTAGMRAKARESYRGNYTLHTFSQTDALTDVGRTPTRFASPELNRYRNLQQLAKMHDDRPDRLDEIYTEASNLGLTLGYDYGDTNSAEKMLDWKRQITRKFASMIVMETDEVVPSLDTLNKHQDARIDTRYQGCEDRLHQACTEYTKDMRHESTDYWSDDPERSKSLATIQDLADRLHPSLRITTTESSGLCSDRALHEYATLIARTPRCELDDTAISCRTLPKGWKRFKKSQPSSFTAVTSKDFRSSISRKTILEDDNTKLLYPTLFKAMSAYEERIEAQKASTETEGSQSASH